MNNRTLTVKGVGSVSMKADMIVISIMQDTQALKYGKTMEKAAEALDQIRQAIVATALDPSELKTDNFSVNTHYESKRDAQGNYRNHFKGYRCIHRLDIQFDYDMQQLGKVLSALAGCEARPEFSIKFSVRN